MKRPELETDPSKLPGQIVNEIPGAVRLYGGAREGGKAVTLRDIIDRINREEEYSPHATVNS